MPAYAAVPHAMITILSTARSSASSMRSSSSTSRPAASVRPSRVSATACGWSWISLAMKFGKPPFSAAAASQSTVNRRACAGAPSKSVTSTPSGVIVTTWSWPSSSASRVCAMNAGDVAAQEVLALADPDHQGGVVPGADDDVGDVRVHGQQREGALQAARHGAHRRGQVAAAGVRGREQVRGDLGVRLGQELHARGHELGLERGEVLDDAVVDDRELAVRGTCGWALRSVGAPWVAQRVCPMAAVAPGSGCASRYSTRFASLPAFLAVTSSPPRPVTRATPAES